MGFSKPCGLRPTAIFQASSQLAIRYSLQNRYQPTGGKETKPVCSPPLPLKRATGCFRRACLRPTPVMSYNGSVLREWFCGPSMFGFRQSSCGDITKALKLVSNVRSSSQCVAGPFPADRMSQLSVATARMMIPLRPYKSVRNRGMRTSGAQGRHAE